MKNSILYIVGAVALLGGGAFLFLKSKKNKDKEKLALVELQNTTINTPKVESQAQEEVKSAQDVINLAEATSVAKQIYNLKQVIDNAKYHNIRLSSSDWTARITKAKNDAIIQSSTKSIPTLIQKLSDLGYSESYGVAIKK